MNEIEEKFYKCFNIKPCKRGFTLKDCADRDCSECGYFTAKITDRILLKLIVIAVNNNALFDMYVLNTDELKGKVLEWAISFNPFSDIINRDDFVKYVQSLFTEV